MLDKRPLPMPGAHSGFKKSDSCGGFSQWFEIPNRSGLSSA
jgi:hypothetical protein